MVLKLCAVCAQYFQGELDGDYSCPDCRKAGHDSPRRLNSLESLDQTTGGFSRGKAGRVEAA